MDTKDTSGPAFPTVAGQTVYSNGMTLRDWFAGQALASLAGDINPHLPNSRASAMWPEPQELADRRAKWAYLQADAMLAARK